MQVPTGDIYIYVQYDLGPRVVGNVPNKKCMYCTYHRIFQDPFFSSFSFSHYLHMGYFTLLNLT